MAQSLVWFFLSFFCSHHLVSTNQAGCLLWWYSFNTVGSGPGKLFFSRLAVCRRTSRNFTGLLWKYLKLPLLIVLSFCSHSAGELGTLQRAPALSRGSRSQAVVQDEQIRAASISGIGAVSIFSKMLRNA